MTTRFLDEAAEERAHEFDDVRCAMNIMLSDPAVAHYCVSDRIPSGVVIIGARPKFKKSWFALQLGIAKACAGQFMSVPVERCRVLYLAFEDNDHRMRKRFEFFGITLLDGNFPHDLHIAYDWPTGALGIEKLYRWLELHPDTKLIVIDVLQRFRGSREKNESVYEGDYRTMTMLHGLTQRHPELTVLVVHHVRKGPVDDPIEAINGSFGIAGAADAYIILRRGTEKDQVIAHIDGRDWESWDHEFVWQFKQGEGWVQIGLADGVELTATQQEIIRFATDDGGCTTPTKLAQFRQIAKPTAWEALQALVSKGAMRCYSGKYYVNERN